MGYRVALIAVRGIDIDTLYARYGVSGTGERQEIAEAPICGAEVSNGWNLLYLNQYPRPHDAILAGLSAGAELVFCDVNETSMASFATGWADGEEEWLVFHDSQQSLTHLVTNGTLPEQFERIRDAKALAQAEDGDEVDHTFDVPVDLFESLTGIRHDRDLPGATGDDFEVLAPK